MAVTASFPPTQVSAPRCGDADTDAQRGSDFAQLCRRVRAAGLLDRRHASYLVRIIVTVCAYAGAWAAFAWLGNSWLQLITAGVLGLLFTRRAPRGAC